MELIAGLWSKLPSELLEQMLPFLPVPDLCRFRSVCKRWNLLICTPEFGTLCIQNASNGANEGACFVVKLRLLVESTRTGRRCAEILSWSIFDLNTKRWYNVEDELPKGYDYDVSAMDGGLVCTFVNAFTDEQHRTSTIDNPTTTQPQTLIVFNLIEKRLKALPNPPLVRIDLPYLNLKLVVDNISQTYKIFLICVGYFWNPRDPCMCVYESSTNQWRIPPNTPNPPDPWGNFGADVRSVVFQGLLYGLFGAHSGIIGRLYRYNFVEDAWEDTGVKFWKSMLDLCDLVVSHNRLFLMTQRLVDRSLVDRRLTNNRSGYTHTPWPLDISEILLADKVCRTVVQMTEAEVHQNFDIQPNDRCSFKIHGDGFDKSILLMSKKVHGKTGKYVLYNLVTGLWEFQPPNPVEHLRFRSRYRGSLWRHGKHMSYLRLPNAPWL